MILSHWSWLIEPIFSMALLINALLFIPQILTIRRARSARGVSLVTFLGFWCIQLATVLHGVLHHDWRLVLGYVFSMITCGTVVILIWSYSRK